jgi:hypothetical protein
VRNGRPGLASVVAPGLVAACLGFPAGDPPAPPRRHDAEAQLEHATRARLAARSAPPLRREEARERAIRALEAVCEYFPGDSLVCAEACFRRGEMLRADGLDAAALRAFERARERGGGTPFAPRATLEIGHVHRRAGRGDDALDAYFAVALDRGARAPYRDTALLWAGDEWLRTGETRQARRAWEHVARSGERALDRIRAFDRIALSHLADGDVGGARRTLARCDEALANRAAERTELGESVRGALGRMRARSRSSERARVGSSEGATSADTRGAPGCEPETNPRTRCLTRRPFFHIREPDEQLSEDEGQRPDQAFWSPSPGASLRDITSGSPSGEPLRRSRAAARARRAPPGAPPSRRPRVLADRPDFGSSLQS